MIPGVGWRLYALIALLALVPRITLALLYQGVGGDSALYETVALNILENACVSLSSPGEGACVPHWGGNQLPGYPIFLAVVWGVFGKSTLAANIVQSFLWTGAACYLVYAIQRFTGKAGTALFVGIVLALSPLQMPWVRMTLTETLALTAVLWVFAELILSLSERRLRIVPLGIGLAAALFVRYDLAFLCLAAAVIGFHIYLPAQALKRGLALALVVAVPLVGWTARNVVVGLGIFPHSSTMEHGDPPPLGYFAWGNTWTTNQYQYPSWNYPVFKRNYAGIHIDRQIYSSESEKVEVEHLLEELRTYQEEPFPMHIDKRFAELAAIRVSENPLWHSVGLRLVRTWNTWFNPRNSAGWPVDVPLGVVGTASIVELAVAYPVSALTRGLTGLYRIGLLVAMLALLAMSIAPSMKSLRPIIWAAGIVTLGRILMYAGLDLVETRYALGSVPGIEIVLCLTIMLLIQKRSKHD